jgi:hypothetical protein
MLLSGMIGHPPLQICEPDVGSGLVGIPGTSSSGGSSVVVSTVIIDSLTQCLSVWLAGRVEADRDRGEKLEQAAHDHR